MWRITVNFTFAPSKTIHKFMSLVNIDSILWLTSLNGIFLIRFPSKKLISISLITKFYNFQFPHRLVIDQIYVLVKVYQILVIQWTLILVCDNIAIYEQVCTVSLSNTCSCHIFMILKYLHWLLFLHTYTQQNT
jgi:hypothetical protein